LLKILSRITLPTEGYAEVYGRVGSLLEVGTGFHPELTGRENIYLNGAIIGMKKAQIDRRFDEIVSFADIERFLDTPVKRYSSGMYVRLAFAVAAHLEPEILVVDEVLAVGDAEFQKKCLGKMGDAAGGGKTVLFVSHNMAAVRKLCSQAVLLDQGRIAATGQTESVIASYLPAPLAEASPVAVLPPGPPEAPGHGLTLRFSGSDGAPRSKFLLGESWRISLEFKMRRRLDHVIAAVGFMTTDGLPIIAYWSSPRDLAPGRYGVEYECEVPLSSCVIQFAVGLSTHEKAFYYVEGVGSVSITEVAKGAQPFRASGTGILASFQRSAITPLD
jgi:lipopolysaccharide transport system ATP-binding protein